MAGSDDFPRQEYLLLWYVSPRRVDRSVSEEVLRYLVRLLEDLELNALDSDLKPGQVSAFRVRVRVRVI